MNGRLAVVPYAEVRIHIGEPIGVGLRRVSLAQFDRAIAGLFDVPDRREGIHTTRKALKRLRALLRLVRAHLPKGLARTAGVALRDVGRRLASVREADVAVGTLDGLVAGDAVTLAREVAGLRARLVGERDAAFARTFGDPGAVLGLVAVLEEARAGWAGGPVGETMVGLPRDFGAVAQGLVRTYRRGRRRMASALNGGSTEYHEWRKVVKALRYQLETLSTAWPEVIGRSAEAADDLGEILGLEHDLAVLGRLVDGAHDLTSGASLTRMAFEAQARLRSAAGPLGERVYAEDPKDFVQRIGAYWAAGPGIGAVLESGPPAVG